MWGHRAHRSLFTVHRSLILVGVAVLVDVGLDAAIKASVPSDANRLDLPIPPAIRNPKFRLPDLKLALLPQLMYLLGPMDFLVPAELIDHNGPRPPAPERGVTAEYGAYLAGLCSICHGPGFSGGPIPGTPPEDPPALNLTPAGALQNWTFEEFLTAMRTGKTPYGRQLREEFMPYETLFGDMTDEEWEAIWLYLQTLPSREYGNR